MLGDAMSALLTFILAMAAILEPRRDHNEIGSAIENAISHRGCLYRGSDCEHKTAATMTVWGWFESHLTLDALGKAHDCGPFQHVTHDPAECMRLRTDAEFAAFTAWDDMHASLVACGDLSGFARGTSPAGCLAGRALAAKRTLKVVWTMRKAGGQ